MPDGSPISDIMQMRQHGLSNNQIIQGLQRQGYSNTQIFDAMNQADTKMAVEGMHPVEDTFSHEVFTEPRVPEMHNAPVQDTFQDIDTTKVEELVETVIEEKWEELLRDVNKIVEWKNKVETRLSEVEVKLDNLKDNFSDLQKVIIGKVNDYDKNIQEVGAEIKAMEKVFSKVLPVFTENVNELSNISKRIKGDLK